MNIEELCVEVNKRIKSERIKVADGRTSLRVTARHVRYYRSIGLMTPPGRDAGRAVYGPRHVEEVLVIKRSQQKGMTLVELQSARGLASTLARAGRINDRWNWTAERSLTHGLSTQRSIDTSLSFAVVAPKLRSMDPSPVQPEAPSEPERPSEVGWSIRVGEFTVSGPGSPPDQRHIKAIIGILTR